MNKSFHKSYTLDHRVYQVLTLLALSGSQSIYDLSKTISYYTGEKRESVKVAIYRALPKLRRNSLITEEYTERNHMLSITPLGLFLLSLAFREPWNTFIVFEGLQNMLGEEVKGLDLLYGLHLIDELRLNDFVKDWLNKLGYEHREPDGAFIEVKLSKKHKEKGVYVLELEIDSSIDILIRDIGMFIMNTRNVVTPVTLHTVSLFPLPQNIGEILENILNYYKNDDDETFFKIKIGESVYTHTQIIALRELLHKILTEIAENLHDVHVVIISSNIDKLAPLLVITLISILFNRAFISISKAYIYSGMLKSTIMYAKQKRYVLPMRTINSIFSFTLKYLDELNKNVDEIKKHIS